MRLITDSNDPRFQELSEIWGPAVHSRDMIERNGAIAIAWLMESTRAALAAKEKAERELADEKQKVANLEEYMLKGVAFRDELQAQLCEVKEIMNNAAFPCAVCEQVIAALSSSSPCPHEEEAKRLREAGLGAMAAVEERIRQKSVEGWTPEHDAQHSKGELAIAAACYALNKMPNREGVWLDEPEEWWPWHPDWDKREKHSRERSLAIAAALCMAELDRLARRRADAGREG